MSIHYLLHLRLKELFHGDIKPANLFFDGYRRGFVTSDSGTILLLDDEKKEYHVRMFTPYYCSKEFRDKIKKGLSFTVAELRKEDAYQFK
jgi:predicted unusual protein kinase regulating ubiquinone biosynthesis (AarF/ABC1/UbiB family)